MMADGAATAGHRWASMAEKTLIGSIPISMDLDVYGQV
jgi:hypothetical protein